MKVNHSDLNQVTADGAGNAIGSVSEYESRTRSYRGNDVEVEVCIAHQNERSGGYASGTIKFEELVNVDLGTFLAKSHKLQTFLSRSTERMSVYKDVAEDNGRCPILLPNPGNETRWHSSIDEAIRANAIMGDVCESFRQLFSEGGLDHEMLDAAERESGDIERFTYTEDEKMILRQYAAASLSAKILTKFLQSKGNSRFSYLLFYVQWCLRKHDNPCFRMSKGML